MTIEGKFVAFNCFVSNGKEITFKGNMVTYSERDLRSDEMKVITAPYEMKRSDSLVPNASCHELDVKTEGQQRKPDFVYHVENINGKDVEIISRMTMEYDGRGRIVTDSYVKEENLSLVNEDYESLVYQTCNHRKSTPMTFHGVPGGMGSMMGMNGMGSMMGINGMGSVPGADLSADEPKIAGPAWDCACGQKGITGKFCPNCGMPRPSLS